MPKPVYKVKAQQGWELLKEGWVLYEERYGINMRKRFYLLPPGETQVRLFDYRKYPQAGQLHIATGMALQARLMERAHLMQVTVTDHATLWTVAPGYVRRFQEAKEMGA